MHLPYQVSTVIVQTAVAHLERGIPRFQYRQYHIQYSLRRKVAGGLVRPFKEFCLLGHPTYISFTVQFVIYSVIHSPEQKDPTNISPQLINWSLNGGCEISGAPLSKPHQTAQVRRCTSDIFLVRNEDTHGRFCVLVQSIRKSQRHNCLCMEVLEWPIPRVCHVRMVLTARRSLITPFSSLFFNSFLAGILVLHFYVALVDIIFSPSSFDQYCLVRPRSFALFYITILLYITPFNPRDQLFREEVTKDPQPSSFFFRSLTLQKV